MVTKISKLIGVGEDAPSGRVAMRPMATARTITDKKIWKPMRMLSRRLDCTRSTIGPLTYCPCGSGGAMVSNQ